MSMAPIKLLLQTTIPATSDDWSIERFSLLACLFDQDRDAEGARTFEVLARNRDPLGAPDPILSALDAREFDQVWLMGVDVGNGLTEEDCAGISRFRSRGGGLLVARDHMDLGSSLCNLAGVGKAHYFHSRNRDPDPRSHQPDDCYSKHISWPNFHSGANGDFQEIEVVGAVHPVLRRHNSEGGPIRFLPSHPHEGAVVAPDDEDARVIAAGKSRVTGRRFNIAVAFERSSRGGRAIAQSTFHHFADYNWDPRVSCPSFVDEPAGDGMLVNPDAIDDIRTYVRNVGLWLSGRLPG